MATETDWFLVWFPLQTTRADAHISTILTAKKNIWQFWLGSCWVVFCWGFFLGGGWWWFFVLFFVFLVFVFFVLFFLTKSKMALKRIGIKRKIQQSPKLNCQGPGVLCFHISERVLQ